MESQQNRLPRNYESLSIAPIPDIRALQEQLEVMTNKFFEQVETEGLWNPDFIPTQEKRQATCNGVLRRSEYWKP